MNEIKQTMGRGGGRKMWDMENKGRYTKPCMNKGGVAMRATAPAMWCISSQRYRTAQFCTLPAKGCWTVSDLAQAPGASYPRGTRSWCIKA